MVLSAGGMFGAWQAGVWRALAAHVKPDLIAGASAGALNGWAIAGGATPDELAAAWLDPEMADLIRLRAGRSPFDPEPLRRAARTLVNRYPPRIPFATTLVEVPRMRLRVVRGEAMTWQHLVAACSIPVGFPPVRLDGHWYVDGGLLGPLPLWVAAKLGATRAIALDALPLAPSRILRGAVRVVRKLSQPPRTPAGFPVTLIRPSQRLGGVRDALYWKEDNVRRWLELGERDYLRSQCQGE